MYIRIYRRDGGVDVDSLKQSVLECVTNGDPMVVFVTIEAIPALFEQGNRIAIMALVSCCVMALVSCFQHEPSGHLFGNIICVSF